MRILGNLRPFELTKAYRSPKSFGHTAHGGYNEQMSFTFGVRHSASAIFFSFVSALFLAFAVVTILPLSSSGQFPQMRRQQERIQASEKAEAERKREADPNKANSLPIPKKAVMNVDVQAVLAKGDHKTFAEAKIKQAKAVADGDDLWLYLKFNGKLGDYARAIRDAETGEIAYRLYAEIAPQGDATTLNRYVLSFSREELLLPELKINLAPGLPGRNAATPLFVEVAGSRQPGRWNTEFRLTNSSAVPRAMTDNLATATVTLELPSGPTRYSVLRTDFPSMLVRGTTDTKRLPLAGAFYRLPLKLDITKKLTADGIEPVRFFFASDAWLETGASMLNPQPSRKVFAAFTYRKGEACHYGVAEAIQKYDPMRSIFVWDRADVTPGLPLDCAQLD